ncbi:MAG: BlaI/MecI/CopY family transcriptional regulator [Lachnospiraceae bacterium]|nr:BlaI/MecI/CopY family transcriptional regulator [Lachnospiraceae bacterium]MBQ6106427.1 BlaI/MecI/CopY family transcriptional regulator [Lachnospiraceae bacterium]
MNNGMELGVVEGRFAEIIWEHAPVSSSDLVKLALERLNWKRTTTHTVISKLCDKKLFARDENGIITVLVSKEEYNMRRADQLINNAYGGSLPMFISGFVKQHKLSEKEIAEIKRIIEDR